MLACPRLGVRVLALAALSSGLLAGCSRSHGPRRAIHQPAEAGTAAGAVAPLPDAGSATPDATGPAAEASVAAPIDAALPFDATLDASTTHDSVDACERCSIDADAEPDAGIACVDLDLCARASLEPDSGACVQRVVACQDDGIDCTLEVCDPELGCAHVPNDGVCHDENPCKSSACDAEHGCVSLDLEDGQRCAEDSCSQRHECLAGVCVAKGTRDVACDRWFTPGDSGMLPWDQQACGSNYGDGLEPGLWNDQGSYSLSYPTLLANDDLVFVPRYGGTRKLRFDGTRWSSLELPVAERTEPWETLALRGNELLLVQRTAAGCPLALLFDIVTGLARPYADGMAAAPGCAQAGRAAFRANPVRAAEDGSLWSFTNVGLFKFVEGAWLDQGLPDAPAGDIGDIAIDADGVEWVIGGREHYLWTRVDNQWRSVELPPLTPAFVISHVFNSRGALLFNTKDTVLELNAHGVVRYPTLTEPGRGIVEVAADELGRPVVCFGNYAVNLAIFDGSNWVDAGWAESLANDTQHRLYVASHGRVERLVGTSRLPLGPIQRHVSFSAGAALPPYQLSMQGGARLDWMDPSGDAQREGGMPVTITVKHKTLRADVWQGESVSVTVPPAHLIPLSTRQPDLLRRHGDKLLVMLPHSRLTVVEGSSGQSVAFPSANNLLLEESIGTALAPDGRIAIAYPDIDGVLRIARVEGTTVVEERVVPGAALYANNIELVSTADGLVVFWQEQAANWPHPQFAKLLTGDMWRDLPTPPHGRSVVDARGRVWRTGYGVSETGKAFVEPAWWDGTSWQTLPGGRVDAPTDDGLAFDRAGNPIVLVRDGMALRVLRYRNGAFQREGDAPGGINNSACNLAHAPQIASDGEQVCVSWLEAAEQPSELMLRCLKLD